MPRRLPIFPVMSAYSTRRFTPASNSASMTKIAMEEMINAYSTRP
jgi:hypothetical protein